MCIQYLYGFRGRAVYCSRCDWITQGRIIAKWWIEMMDSRNKESGGIVEANEQ
ncbi:hypothetical protein NXW10_24245 [Bacteroides fragilis]|nr:hypothetical protein NXW10_24245 [Bacteroides fragilis]